MTTKVLSVQLRGIDQLTPSFRAAVASSGQLTQSLARTEAASGSMLVSVQNRVRGLRTVMAGVAGGLGVGLIARSIDATARRMDALLDKSRALRIDPQTLASWQYFAEVSGSSSEEVTTALSTAQKNIGQFVQTGGGRSAEVIRNLNLRLRDSEGRVRSISELLPDIADEINRIPDAERRAFAASRLFGDAASSGTFVNVLTEGGERLRQMNREAQRLGIVFSPTQMRAAEEYVDAVRRVSMAFEGLKARAVEALAPLASDLADRVAGLMAGLPKMVQRVRQELGQALVGGESGASSRAKFAELAESFGDLLYTGISGGVRLAGAFFADTWRFMLRDAGTSMDSWVEGRIKALPMLLARAGAQAKLAASAALYQYGTEVDSSDIAGSIARVEAQPTPYGRGAAGKAMMLRDLRIYGGQIDAAQQEIELIERRQRQLDEELATRARRRLSGGLNPGGDLGVYSGMRAVFDGVADSTGRAAKRFGDAADALIGYRQEAEAFTQQSRQWQREYLGPFGYGDTGGAGSGGSMGDRSAFGQFRSGAVEYLGTMTERLDTLQESGRKLGQTITESLGTNLSSAITRTMDNVRDFGSAFREMGAGVLRSIRDMIVQMLTFRLVASVFSGAFAATTPTAAAGPVPYPGGPLALNRGGGVPMPAVWRSAAGYDAGGTVMGPSVPVDRVPAWLTGGEYILPRQSASRQDPAVLEYARRGGELAPAGAAPPISITINMGGTGAVDSRTIATLKQEVTRGVVEALERSPGYRAQMRRGLEP